MYSLVLILLFHCILACSCQKTTEYKKKIVSIAEWTISDKVQTKAISAAHCGVYCMKKYDKEKSCTAIIFDESNSVCTAASLAYFPTGLRLAWASSIYQGKTNAWFAIDRNDKTGTFELKNIFRSDDNGDTHPWFAIDLLVAKEITEVAET